MAGAGVAHPPPHRCEFEGCVEREEKEFHRDELETLFSSLL